MKDRLDLFSGNAGLQVSQIQTPAEGVTEQLAEHSHRFLLAGLGLDRRTQRGKMLRARPLAGMARMAWMHEQLDGARKFVIPADLAEDALRQRLDAVPGRIEELRAE